MFQAAEFTIVWCLRSFNLIIKRSVFNFSLQFSLPFAFKANGVVELHLTMLFGTTLSKFTLPPQNKLTFSCARDTISFEIARAFLPAVLLSVGVR